MRFNSVEMKNYRQYQNVSFDFSKTLPTDLHIIKASNGVGKTNLLNAVNWCLYGDEPHLSDGEHKLSICTESVLKTALDSGDLYCDVEVEIRGTDGSSHIRINRSVKVNSETGNYASKDNLVIEENFSDGRTEYYEKDAATMRIDSMFPVGIREYFFFDGEQLLNYFGEKTSTSAIKDSIYSIAQINSIQEAHKHLDEIIKGYNKSMGDSQPRLLEILKKRDDAIEARDNRSRELEELKLQIKHAYSECNRLDKLIAGSKDALSANEERNENRAKLVELTSQKARVAEQINSLIRKYTVLLYLYDANKKTLDYIIQEEKNGALNPNIDTDVIMRSLEKHKCVVCDEDLTAEVEKRLQEIVNNVKVSGATQRMFTQLKTELTRAIIQAKDYMAEKQQLVETYNMLQTRIEELEEKNELLTEKIKTCSDLKGAERYMEEKKRHEETIKSNMLKQGRYEESLDNIRKKVKELEEEYNKVEKECKVSEETKQYRDFALEAVDIICEIENEMADEVKTRMETKTMELFTKLMWKEHSYSRIELDRNFRFQLFNMDGKSCFDTCSAAEKELLALAFTIALHEVSGYDNLLFIDTPVGRVSDVNRSNFARVLKDISLGKQIVLAFTPSEYSSEISTVLNETVVSSFNELTSNEISTERR